jgi:hypothetical protein
VQLERNSPITAGKQDGRLVRNLANEIKINRNVIVGFPDHEARVFEAPLNIGNDELRLRRCLRAIDVYLHRNRQAVSSAEQSEQSAHLNGRVA